MSQESDLTDSISSGLVLPSFAKVNLCLEIIGKREDGFHEVRTLLQTIDLKDEITFRVASSDVHLSVSGRNLWSNQENIVLRALRLFAERYETEVCMAIKLWKQIPVGAGLGGGSSNAAMTLLALNQLAGHPFTSEDLLQLAADLGSDVPFFLTGGLAFAWGRGEKTESWAGREPQGELIVVYPGFESSTKAAYSEVRAPDPIGSGLLTSGDPDTTIRRFRRVLDLGDWSEFRNDLEQPVLDRYPDLRKILAILRDSGCDFAGMSGSGSALFGTGSEASLEQAERDCITNRVGDVFRTRFVSASEYWSSLGKAGLVPPKG